MLLTGVHASMMLMRLLLLAALLRVARCSLVCELDENNFNDTVKDGVFAIFFYKYGCHACRRFERTVFSPLAFECHKANVRFCKVACDEAEGEKICDEFGVSCPYVSVLESGAVVFNTSNLQPREMKSKLVDYLSKYIQTATP